MSSRGFAPTSITCPLAIEIAAGQVRRLPLESIEGGVTKPLDLHASSLRRRTGRQQTLRQTLEWSYELLAPDSRQVLERLSVFSGPFREEQALAVCAADMPNEQTRAWRDRRTGRILA